MTEATKTELELLREKADALSITYAANATAATLQKKIDEHTQAQAEAEEPAPKVEKPKTDADYYNEQMRLRRIIISSNDPVKTELPGELHTVANNICNVSRFIPFNNENGWVCEQILLDTLKEKQLQRVIYVKGPNGMQVPKSTVIPAYNIVILEDMTQAELDQLAKDQSARGSIDN